MTLRIALLLSAFFFFNALHSQGNGAPIELVYVTSDKEMVAQAAQPDEDPIIRMLQADSNFNVTILVLADDASVDLTGYNVVIVQEGFNSDAAILQPGASLGLANINVPFLYNKTYALRDGRALASGGGISAPLAGMSITVDPGNQGNELFNAITFSNNTFDVFYHTANDDGADGEKAFNYTYGLTISDGSTLLGTAEEIQYPATTAFINDVPAGTTIGSETLNARMLILGMNFGAICYNDGNNLTEDGLLLWRNAIYSLAGLEVPTDPITTMPEFQLAGYSDHFEFYSSIPDSEEHILSISDELEKGYANYTSIWERPNSNTIFPEDQKISVYYCAREDNPLFTSSTPEWDCGSNAFASAAIYICEPASSVQLEYYGDLASVAVNELSQMAMRGLLDREIDPWYAEGFGLYEIGYRPDRVALLQKLSELGTQEPVVESLYDISNLNESGNIDLMASFFESKALLGSYFFGHYSNNLYEWWQLLKHYYIKETDRIGIRYSTEHFDYYAAEKEMPYLEAMADNMEEQLILQESRFIEHIDHRINICIYDNEVGLEINNRTNFQGLAEGADKINSSHLEIGHYGLLNHEFMHLWVNILCPFSFERIPYPGQFLNEGLAESTDRFMTDEEMPAHRYKIDDLFYHYQRKYNREPAWLEIVDNAEVNEEDGFWVDAYALGEMYWRYMHDKYPDNFWLNVKLFLEQDRDWTIFGGKSTEEEGAEFIQFMKELAFVGPPLETVSVPFYEDFKNEFTGWTRMRFGGNDQWQLTSNTGYDDDSCAFAVDPYWFGEEEDKTIDSWLVSPPMDASGSDALKVQFMYRQAGAASKPEVYYTGIFKGPTLNTDWIAIENLNWTAPEWTWDKMEFEIDNPPEKLYVALRFQSAGDETYSYNIDNFSVNEPIAATIPQVTTLNATAITPEQGILNGTILSDGSASITQRGFYWSTTNSNPSDSDNKVTIAGTTGEFSYELTGLASGTTYYFRAFATNAEGTAMGAVISFTTAENIVALSLPFFDDFEEAISNDASFLKWTSENISGWNYWHIIPWGGINGSQCMRFEKSGIEQEDWLITLPINCTEEDELKISFNEFHNGDGPRPALYFTTAYNGNKDDSDWTEINYSLGQAEDQWNSINDLVINSPGEMVYFAFKYESAESVELLFLLDNFSVEGILTDIEMNIRRDNSLMIYPNPVTPNSRISFEIDIEQDVDISLYDIYGMKISTLVHSRFPEGKHILSMNNYLQSAGVYFCKFAGKDSSSVIKLIVE